MTNVIVTGAIENRVVIEGSGTTRVVRVIAQGPVGPGVPVGGTTSQILRKASGDDYDTEWADPASASSVAWGNITGTLSDQTDLQSALDALGGGGASELSELSDVGSSTPTNRNALMADGDSWESRPLVEADISDLGSYVETLADLGVTASATELNYVDGVTSAIQTQLNGKADTSHSHTASQVTDFDTEVSNNTDVAANTSARHAAVTVTDSSEIDFTLAGQNITASIVSGSLDETKLDASVNASLDLADSSVQPGDNISTLTNDSGFITATLTNEQVQDIVGGMVSGNTETFVSVTYQDGDGTIDFVVPVLDEDDMVSDSAAHLATQQSIKAYVDANAGGVSDHGALTGLADDDHTQYTLSSGTRDFTGIVSYDTHPTFTADTQIVDKRYVDDSITAGGGYTDEDAQDAVGAMLTGTQTLITVSYDDPNGELDFVVNDDLSLYDNTTSGFITDYTVTEADVTAHEAALTITESQISDLGSYLTDITGENLSSLADVTITSITSGELLRWNGSAWVNNTLAEAGVAAASHTHTASEVTDFDTEVSNNTDVAANTSARHSAVTVTDSSEIDFTLTGQNITASIVTGSIDETKLDTSVNASLDLADSASQPGHTHTASNITDFDTEVANNSAVTANTAKVTNATHTGDVTGSTTLTIANDAVTTSKIADGSVTLAKIQDITAHGVLATGASTTAPSIVTAAANTVLGRIGAGGTVQFSQLLGNQISNNTITNAKLLTVLEGTIKGRVSTGTGVVEDLTASEVRTLLNVADGATANTGTVTSVAVSGSDGIEVDSGSPITSSGTIALGVNASALRSHINVEDGADVTDETNVLAALNGATLTDVGTPASGDRIILQDASDSNIVKYAAFSEFGGGGGGVDTSGTPVANDFARFTDADTIEGRSYSEVRTDLGLVIGTDVQAQDAFLDDIAALTDPGADRLMFWDDSAGEIVWLSPDSTLSITGTTLAVNPSAIALDELSGWTSILTNIATLTDPGADRIGFWDDSAGAFTWLTASTGLTISGTSMTVRTASTSQTGIAELATVAETSAGTDTGRIITPDGLAGSRYGTKSVSIAVYPAGTDVETGDGTIAFVVPEDMDGMNLVRVVSSVDTSGTTGLTSVQVRRRRDATNADMLSTVCSIDSGETRSTTAATAFAINATNDDVAEGDKIYIDVDAVSTTAPQGLSVTLSFRMP